jgi:hypothetical protein
MKVSSTTDGKNVGIWLDFNSIEIDSEIQFSDGFMFVVKEKKILDDGRYALISENYIIILEE